VATPSGIGGNLSLKFSDVGGLEETKAEIGKLVQSRLDAKRYRNYGVVQNGILLHGPRGSGKTFLAEATAGQFGLHYEYVSPTSLKDMWVGATEGNIRRLFENAAAKCPVLLFIDEIDGPGAARQVAASDPGGGRKASNDAVVQLMQCIDQYRSLPGFVLMAATNLLDALDPALIREGRFDLKIRVDLPDEAARRRILESLLAGKPSNVSDLGWLAARTPGFSAAKLRAVVDRAAVIAAESRRKIEDQDLKSASDAMGGKDRPLLEPVNWRDLVIDVETEQELRELIGLLNDPDSGRQWKIHPPTGVLLVGPPGTGKSLLARLVASQTRRSFYPITASDVLGGQVGESVKNLTSVFERAKENRPSILFFDEIDGLLPSRDGALLNQHDVQLVEQCLTEISNLSPQNDVFLIGTTNHLDQIDPRVLRGGRFSEKIQIGLPSVELRQRLFARFLDGLLLAPDASFPELAKLSDGLSHADIQAVCEAAKRFAHRRARDGQALSLIQQDFKKAMERVRVSVGSSLQKSAAGD
jgi:transitional endoplasmic reticulum ATPase